MPNTDDGAGWHALLASLTDDELKRYGEIAADQRRNETNLAWAQVVCAAGALLSVGWFVRELLGHGITWRSCAALGLAGVLGYWPYRKAVVRRLWGRHCQAVKAEINKRRDAAGDERNG